MKSWLLKSQTSNALNELETALRNQPPKSDFPSSLHDSIMRSVRKEVLAQEAVPVSALRWAPISAFACVVGLAFIIAVSNSRLPATAETQPEARAFEAADSVLELGGNIVREAPGAAISPLEDEMQRVHQDMDRTKDFLIASLP